ncbi:hypothetical protein QYE76_016696 [Lolium multiflorum]|uniref:Integrase catalytic domain-containing protein n=1 Tax=Lolium multiflorum TaxID=4521 RepID=A0AAD8QEW3_LOLMU|nr:hypothetical protein QYE76_016696 [Lolium multiflorum]
MPGTRSLLETIQGLHQATQVIRTRRINKPRWLTHINLLIKNAMKKGILNIQLAKRPPTSDSHRKQNTNGGWLDNRVESILSDWGGEYRNLSSFFQKHGIAHRVACPHTHQQNGVAEHRNKLRLFHRAQSLRSGNHPPTRTRLASGLARRELDDSLLHADYFHRAKYFLLHAARLRCIKYVRFVDSICRKTYFHLDFAAFNNKAKSCGHAWLGLAACWVATPVAYAWAVVPAWAIVSAWDVAHAWVAHARVALAWVALAWVASGDAFRLAARFPRWAACLTVWLTVTSITLSLSACSHSSCIDCACTCALSTTYT